MCPIFEVFERLFTPFYLKIESLRKTRNLKCGFSRDFEDFRVHAKKILSNYLKLFKSFDFIQVE